MYDRAYINQWISERQTINSTYFKDNIRKIDAIIVFNMSQFSDDLETFLNNLRKIGIHLEFAVSTKHKNLIFCKVHAPVFVLEKYAKLFDIPLKKDQTLKFELPIVPCLCIETILNSPQPDPEHPVSKRAWQTISKSQPTEITICERIVILFAIMDYIPFGTQKFQIGIKQLLHKNIISAAFPLHDGPWEWPDDPDEPLNDRQLLARYWASIFMVYKQQPLYTVENYFGYEFAMYFAWLGFYNKMLIYASIMGVIFFIAGFYFIYSYDVERINIYCASSYVHCAEHNTWQRMKFSDHCVHTYISYMNANLGTFFYSCLMIIWCTIFKELWKREMNILNIKWSKTTSEDFLLRPDFVASAKFIRLHKYTREPELYISVWEKIIRYTCSTLITVFLLCLEIGSLALIIYLESFLKSLLISRIIITCIICVLSALCMTFSEKLIFDKVAVITTKIELPQTELQYEKSVNIKSCIYAFINNYGRLLYIAFLKGRFEIPSQTLSQICMLPGCIFEVILMMFTILLFKPFFDNFVEVHRPLFFVVVRKLSRGTINLENKPRWERENDMNPVASVLGELEEMMIQYGLVACFAACCPLAPLFALMHNFVEIKVDSIKFLKYYKRPVEKKQISSIGMWFDLFQSLTYVIIIVNAFFMAYTCNYVYMIYNYFTDIRESYFSYHYFLLNDCYTSRPSLHRVSREKYAFEAGFSLFIITIGFAITAVLSYIIPDMPRNLREYVYDHEQKRRKK